MAPNIKESTYASYSSKLQVHVLPSLENRALKKITALDIEKLVKRLAHSLATSSIRIVFRIVKSCFEAAKERDYIYMNPCERIILSKVNKQKVQALTRERQRAVEAESKKTEQGLPILLALETGMRIGEICTLKWEDIDFDSSVLKVQRTKQRIALPNLAGQRTKIVETIPKTVNASRSIPLSQKIKEALLHWKKQSNSEYVVTANEHSVEPRTVSYRFERIKQKIGEELSFKME
ncbi:hypothetical protein CI088_10510 [Enterococcus plantarum]|uniref:Tyr recombinase domain-containing protein n=2 Tax=Enterococcus plantarum TaxID=1077675 RepID=A0A2W3Z7P2_9ENTE|nr:hypothetical protein CI088_10510 [Enterococcus plantarum]